MKKSLLSIAFLLSICLKVNAQVTIYDTTHTTIGNLIGVEINSTNNGPSCTTGDAIKLAGTERFLNSITVDLFNQIDVSAFTITMSLYSDCPTVSGAGICGSGVGSLLLGSIVTVDVLPPSSTQTLFNVEFPFNNFDLSGQLDNTITVMINASRSDVFCSINQTPVIGSLPVGDTPLSTLTRCGSMVANNGCDKTFTSPTIIINNNIGMKIVASEALKTAAFLSSLFSVFPNPIENIITVNSNKNILVNHISIVDLNGREIKNQSFSNLAEVQMNVADMAAGIYMMNIASSEGIAVKKIIKN